MDSNRKTIKYIINEGGFKYHARKCVMMKGSTISKNIHPIYEVELLKKKLLETGKIIDKQTHYVCKRNIHTGVLMAYNLHQGFLVSELPSCVITINGNEDMDTDIKDSFKLGSTVFAADNPYPKAIEKDCYKIKKILKANICRQFFERGQSDAFSSIESFVVEVLESIGAFKSYRRGDAKKHECDIVVEEEMKQIEIVRFLDEKISDKVRYNRKPISEEQALLFEYCNIGYNIVPEGVMNKFTKKQYTDDYSKELAIYTIGSLPQASEKAERLLKELEKRSDDISTEYNRIHFLVHDPFIAEEVYYCSRDKEAVVSDHSFTYSPIIGRIQIQKDEIIENERYFVIKESLFCDIKQILWMSGEDLNRIYHLL